MDERERCRQIIKQICAEAGKTEDSPFCREVARHLEKCGGCRAQAESLRATLRLYRCLGSEEVPADVTQKLRERLGLL